ncbi:glycosyltransferase [Paraburkholderia sp. GAS334]|uniref:glycosyltransferase n=1 Tax=Paraburkholderia sp. GAS334 TaxID=3035131 RepID=UPI003D21F8A0
MSRTHEVVAAGFGDSVAAENVAFVPLQPGVRSLPARIATMAGLKLGAFERVYWSHPTVRGALDALSSTEVDVIVANDIEALPLALRLSAGRSRVVFDAHEYAPREFEDSRFWRFFFQRYKTYLCRRYIQHADAVLTVSDGIAKEFTREFAVPVQVLPNTPPFFDLAAQPAQSDVVRLVHHGDANPSRRLDRLIEMMGHLDDRFRLDFYLMRNHHEKHYQRLIALATKDSRIRFLPAVPMTSLPKTLNQYDVGVYLLDPTSFNNRFALPNKFFEFVQGRIAVAVGPSPEMAGLVKHYDLGLVSDDFSPKSLADKLSRLTAQDINRLKSNVDRAARELCYERSGQVLSDAVQHQPS